MNTWSLPFVGRNCDLFSSIDKMEEEGEIDEIIYQDDHTEHVRLRYEEQRKECPELYEIIERLIEQLTQKIGRIKC